MSKTKVLYVEDDENLGFITQDQLESEGFEVVRCKDGHQGLQMFGNDTFDICLLDVMLPKQDGFSLAEDIRSLNQTVPIIFLTAKNLDEDKIKGFKTGGDDYLTKPFNMEELILRIDAILKRTKKNNQTEDKSVIHFGQCEFSLKNKLLKTPYQEIRLTPKEAAILNVFCQNPNQLINRDVALKIIYGDDDYFKGRSMDVYIAKIRKYLKDDETLDLINIHGSGFQLNVEGE